MDLGPKGLCGFNALERLFALNIDKWPDWSHGVSRDFWLSVSALGLKGYWLVMMIVWNCEFGKDREQERKHQLGAVMAGIYRRYKPYDLPLYQARLAGIVSDYARQGVFFEGEASTEAAVWAHLQKTPFSAVGLSRCNLNRFMGSLHTAMHRSKRWSIDRFERETLGLEYDMLHSAKLLKKVNLGPPHQDEVAEEGGSTSTRKLQFDDRQSMAFARAWLSPRTRSSPRLSCWLDPRISASWTSFANLRGQC